MLTPTSLECLDRFSVIARNSRNPEEPLRQHTMLLSYFDDSSDDRRKRFFAAGGLVGGESQWNDLHMPWALATINLKEPFRSTDCQTQHGQFEGWCIPACDQLMDKLVTIIINVKLQGFASIVPIADYQAIFPKSGEYDPYYLAVRHTIINMAEIGHRVGQEIANVGMDCWFEDSCATSKTTMRLYHELKAVKSWPQAKYLKGVHFEGKELRPLQAADLIAHEAFKHFDNQGLRRTRIPVQRMDNLLAFIVWRREHLEYLRDNGGPNNLELLTSWARNPVKPKPPTFERYWRNYAK